MDYQPIIKDETRKMVVAPNLLDYEEARRTLNWEDLKEDLEQALQA